MKIEITNEMLTSIIFTILTTVVLHLWPYFLDATRTELRLRRRRARR